MEPAMNFRLTRREVEALQQCMRLAQPHLKEESEKGTWHELFEKLQWILDEDKPPRR
jgi:hypothetical protein